MGNKEQILQDFRKKIRAGYPAGELKNELLDKGFSTEEIEKLFYITGSTHKRDIDNKSLFNDKGSVLKLTGISFLILGIAFNSVRFFASPAGYFLIISGIIMLVPTFLKLANAELKRKDDIS